MRHTILFAIWPVVLRISEVYMFRKIEETPRVAVLALMLWKLFDGAFIYANAEAVKNPLTNKVVPILVHGRELFITSDQALRLSIAHWTSGVFLLLLVWIILEKIVDRN